MSAASEDKSQDRRIKKLILGRPQQALVRFPKGLADVAEAEIRAALSAPLFAEKQSPEIVAEANAIHLKGIAFRELAGLALRLTTAREILWTIDEHKNVSGKAKLAKIFEGITWDLYLPQGANVSLRVSSTASRLFHEGMVKDLCTKALAKVGFTVTSAAEADIALDIRLLHDALSVALSLASAPLHRRGYKEIFKGVASVKEDLAASAIRMALAFATENGRAFVPKKIFVPFSGSGTLGFETALILGQMAPSLFLKPLAVESLPCMPPATAAFLRKKLAENWVKADVTVPQIEFIDNDDVQVDALTSNCAYFNAGLARAGGKNLDFVVASGDALKQKLWPKEASFILLNPPYGDRLNQHGDVYQALGRLLASTAAKAPIAGMAFAPDEGAAERLVDQTKTLEWSVRKVSHGGRPTQLLAFRPKA